MGKHRLIKKYVNRRLYDTELSIYITLNDLKRYVIEGIPFTVVDSKTNEDVTSACLIQIILELETSIPLFTQETLEQIIRVHGNPMQSIFKSFFEKSLALFTDHFNNTQKTEKSDPVDPDSNSTKTSMQDDYINTMAKLTAKNIALWQDLWKNGPKK